MRGETHAAANAAKTHCKSGHEFTELNTHIDTLGKRVCRKCRQAWKRQRRIDRALQAREGATA